MPKKKPTRLQKSTAILKESKATEWRYVNTDNEFKFMNQIFVIDESIEEYKVHNKAGTVEDYTNEAYMDEILVALMSDNNLKFYNQNYDEVEKVLVRI